MEDAAEERAQRAADTDGDGGVAKDRTETFAGKDIGGERRKNHRPRAEADAEKNHINIKQPGLTRIAQHHQSADPYDGHGDIQRIRRLFGQAVGDEAENHPAETAGDAGETKNRRRH